MLLATVGLAILSGPAVAQPFDETKPNILYEYSQPLRKTIVPPQGDVSLDDYLIELYKNADVNFIADVTGRSTDETVGTFPNSTKVREGKWKPTFYAVQEDLEIAQRLADLRYNDSTYLVWSRPDGMRAARLMIETGKNHAGTPLPDESQLHETLDDYLRETMGWKKEDVPTAEDINVKLSEFIEANALKDALWERDIRPKLNDLPPNLRAQILKAFRPALGDLPPSLRTRVVTVAREIALQSRLNSAQYFTDDFWQAARFRVITFDSPFSPAVNVAPAPQVGETPLFARAFTQLSLENLNLRDDIFPPRPVMEPGETKPANDEPVPNVALNETQVPLIGDTLRSTQGLTARQLEAEASLQKTISLQEKRRPLSELLTSIGQTQGVKLNASQEIPAALVTFRVNQMPLGVLMGALARVYGAYWDSQSPTEFTLHARELDELQRLMLRSGKGDFSFSEDNKDSSDPYEPSQRQLAQSIGSLLNQQQIGEGNDFAVADLPEDLRYQLRRHFEEAAAAQLTSSYFTGWRRITPELPVLLRRDASRLTSDWGVELLTSDMKGAIAKTTVRGPALNYESELDEFPQ